MKKRIVLGLFVGAMVVSTLTGCDEDSKSGSSNEQTSTTSVKDEPSEETATEETLTQDMTEYSDIEWPESTITSLLPEPKSTVGEIVFESDTAITAQIANTSDKDFKAYVSECKDMGYTIDYSGGDDMYAADNENGYGVVLSLDDDHVMMILACESDDTVGDIVEDDSNTAQ